MKWPVVEKTSIKLIPQNTEENNPFNFWKSSYMLVAPNFLYISASSTPVEKLFSLKEGRFFAPDRFHLTNNTF